MTLYLVGTLVPTQTMHKIQKHLFTTVACNFSIAAFIFPRKQRTWLNYHGYQF